MLVYWKKASLISLQVLPSAFTPKLVGQRIAALTWRLLKTIRWQISVAPHISIKDRNMMTVEGTCRKIIA